MCIRSARKVSPWGKWKLGSKVIGVVEGLEMLSIIRKRYFADAVQVQMVSYMCVLDLDFFSSQLSRNNKKK